MTYYVSNGMLNPTHSLTNLLLPQGGNVIATVLVFVCLSVNSIVLGRFLGFLTTLM